ncbi:hypothetical protein [Nocardioides dilutus]
MEAVLGLLVFAAIVAVVYAVTQLKDRVVGSAVGAVNRKVHAGTHAEGVAYANTQFFYGIDAPDARVIDALVAGVKAADSPRLVGVGSTYRERVTSSEVVWAHGTKAMTAFRAHAAIVTTQDPNGEEQRGVLLGFADVTTIDGVVAEVSAMRALKHDVLAALSSLDSSVEETVLEWQ